MPEQNTTNDMLDFNDGQKPALPGALNILTILTFIWCGISFLLLLATPAIYKFMSGFMDKALTSGQELSAKQMEDITKGKEAMELAHANIVPTMVVGIIGVILCLVGAMWMRKLKKDGFWLYTAGELLPLIVGLILMGKTQLNGVFAIGLSIVIPVLFVVLYAMQRKYLTK